MRSTVDGPTEPVEQGLDALLRNADVVECGINEVWWKWSNHYAVGRADDLEREGGMGDKAVDSSRAGIAERVASCTQRKCTFR